MFKLNQCLATASWSTNSPPPPRMPQNAPESTIRGYCGSVVKDMARRVKTQARGCFLLSTLNHIFQVENMIVFWWCCVDNYCREEFQELFQYDHLDDEDIQVLLNMVMQLILEVCKCRQKIFQHIHILLFLSFCLCVYRQPYFSFALFSGSSSLQILLFTRLCACHVVQK